MPARTCAVSLAGPLPANRKISALLAHRWDMLTVYVGCMPGISKVGPPSGAHVYNHFFHLKCDLRTAFCASIALTYNY